MWKIHKMIGLFIQMLTVGKVHMNAAVGLHQAVLIGAPCCCLPVGSIPKLSSLGDAMIWVFPSWEIPKWMVCSEKSYT